MNIQHLLSLDRPLVVGTLHESLGLRMVKSLSSSSAKISKTARADKNAKGVSKDIASTKIPADIHIPVDILEARLDSLPQRSLPTRWPLPMIATARHPQEGGKGELSLQRRREMLESALPWAAALDIELRSAKELAPVVVAAHQLNRTVILSHHDFMATPTLETLRKLTNQAADRGADLFKVATQIQDRSDLQRLIEFQLSELPIPVTTMGMGAAGRFSRLVLSGFGAPLCYGWLGKPQVPGQWPAMELTALLAGMLPT